MSHVADSLRTDAGLLGGPSVAQHVYLGLLALGDDSGAGSTQPGLGSVDCTFASQSVA